MSYVRLLDTGFGSVIGFIGLLQIVITNNYNRFTNSHNLQYTIANATSPTFSQGVATQRLPTVSLLRLPLLHQRANVSQQPQTQTWID
jgi:hypothetical protein